MQYDVIIIGAGPSGLASGIHLKQLAKEHNQEITVAIFEKSSVAGGHIISGCVMNPEAIEQLIPNWNELYKADIALVCQDEFLFFTKNKTFNLPIPKALSNQGNYVLSLSRLCSNLAQYALDLGVDIFTGFAISNLIINNDRVCGVEAISSEDINNSSRMAIEGKYTIIAEGARGNCSKEVIKHFALDANASSVQTYGLGIKEVWRLQQDSLHTQGHIVHAIGYPLYNQSYGGGFIYHMTDNLLSLGLVSALDYKDYKFDPYDEFQRFKNHPYLRRLLEGATRIEYGARSVTEGGVQSLPKLTFPGGVLVGDSAGFLNTSKVKGVDSAIYSGMLASKTIFAQCQHQSLATDNCDELLAYETDVKKSKFFGILYKMRNIRYAFNYGFLFGLLYAYIDFFVLRNRSFWTFNNKTPDYARTKIANLDTNLASSNMQLLKQNPVIPDNKVTFNRNSALYLANISYTSGRATHLKLKNSFSDKELVMYGVPELKYCPSGVYQVKFEDNKATYIVQASNCLHCKACDIKDPRQNITWTPPEFGDGPQYSVM